jgi:hypothetical protein
MRMRIRIRISARATISNEQCSARLHAWRKVV